MLREAGNPEEQTFGEQSLILFHGSYRFLFVDSRDTCALLRKLQSETHVQAEVCTAAFKTSKKLFKRGVCKCFAKGNP